MRLSNIMEHFFDVNCKSRSFIYNSAGSLAAIDFLAF